MGLFSSPGPELEWVEPAESREARRRLLELGQESVAYPTRQIADLSEMELQVEQQTRDIMERGPSGARQQALDVALEQATTPIDVANMPELQAIFNQIREQGSLEANRLGRSLQIRGTIGTTGGRDMLGRSLSDVYQRLMREAAPYLSEARQMRSQSVRDVTNIVGQQQTAEAGRLGLGAAIGALRRSIEDARFGADYETALNNIAHRFQIQPRILQSVLTNPETYIRGGGPSEMQKISSAARQITPFINLFSSMVPSPGGGGAGYTGYGSYGGPGVGGSSLTRNF